MKDTIFHFFNAVSADIDSSLVSENAQNKLNQLTKLLPYSQISGLECRLGKSEERVDFQINITNNSSKFINILKLYPILNPLSDLFEDWAYPHSLLNELVHDIWLEYDVITGSELIALPGLFISFKSMSRVDIGKIHTCLLTLNEYLNNFLTHQIIQNVMACIYSLPKGAHITHIGFMPSRSPAIVRLNIADLPNNSLRQYLQDIGWGGCGEKLQHFISYISSFVDYHIIALSIYKEILPEIGIECFLNRQFPSEHRWQKFLELLVELNLCTVEKMQALLAWPGYLQKSDIPDLWPLSLFWNDIFLHENSYSLFWKEISLIKLSYNEDLPVSAKGYLAFGHRWFPLVGPTEYENSLERVDSRESKSLSLAQVDGSQDFLYLQAVEDYYDRANSNYLKYVGCTYQAGIINALNSNADAYHSNNLFCAERAGISEGQIILDAGCGVCGPSIDIANSISNIQIHALTISSEQVKTANRLIEQEKLSEKIKVFLCDFHILNYPDNYFDHVIFLESSGYSYNHLKLFREVYRVLKTRGTLYIKDFFVLNDKLDQKQLHDLEVFNKIYFYRATTVQNIKNILNKVGFQEIIWSDLTSISSTSLFEKSMGKKFEDYLYLNEFGKHHFHSYRNLPIILGDIKCCKSKFHNLH